MPKQMPISPYQEFKLRWEGGCGSEFCKKARKVFFRGRIPCDVLFVGEAPGEVENLSGLPFTGPSGQLLDELIEKGVRPELRLAFTNTVCCIPRDDSGKVDAPSFEQMQLCKPRLEEFIDVAKPKLIVCVGAVSRKHFESGYRHSVKLPQTCPQCGDPVTLYGKGLAALFGEEGNYWECHLKHKIQGPKDKPDTTNVIDIVHPSAILKAPQVSRGLMMQRVIVELRDATEDL